MTMPLSEAIRLGALLKPQALDSEGWPMKSCALQAALEAVGKRVIHDTYGITNYALLETLWPLLVRPAVNPVDGEGNPSLLVVIYRLNDSHHWTRERIAAFVEHIEQQAQALDSLPAEERTVAHVE